jgi:hypothetical protein
MERCKHGVSLDYGVCTDCNPRRRASRWSEKRGAGRSNGPVISSQAPSRPPQFGSGAAPVQGGGNNASPATSDSCRTPPMGPSEPRQYDDDQPGPRFRIRDRVHLRSDPTRRGRIVDGPRMYSGGYEYEVMIGEHEGWYAEAALEVVDAATLPRWGSRDELLRDILLAKLRNPLTDSLYAYGASRTDYEPYQFRPAL